MKSYSSVDYQRTNFCRSPVNSITIEVEVKRVSESSIETYVSSLYLVQKAIILKFQFPIQRYLCQVMAWNPSRTFTFTFFSLVLKDKL